MSTVPLTVNGRAFELGVPATPDHLLKALGLEPATVLIEHNGTALRRAEWGATTLRPGDRLELLRIAAGG